MLAMDAGNLWLLPYSGALECINIPAWTEKQLPDVTDVVVMRAE